MPNTITEDVMGLELAYCCHMFDNPRDGAIYAACHRLPCAIGLWACFKRRGPVSDRDLKRMIARQMGEYGHMSVSVGYWGYECWGRRAEPKLILHDSDGHEEALTGKRLLDEVRRVLCLGYADGQQIGLL